MGWAIKFNQLHVLSFAGTIPHGCIDVCEEVHYELEEHILTNRKLPVACDPLVQLGKKTEQYRSG